MTDPSASVSTFAIDPVQFSGLSSEWCNLGHLISKLKHIHLHEVDVRESMLLDVDQEVLPVLPCLSLFADINHSPWSHQSHSWCSELLSPLCSFSIYDAFYQGCVSLLSVILSSRPRGKPILRSNYSWSSGLSNTEFLKHILSLTLFAMLQKMPCTTSSYIYHLSNWRPG